MSITAEGVREWPILMTGPLVLASLKDIKTETRRVPVARWKNLQVGDRLWVRESWQHEDGSCDDPRCGQPSHIYYRATESYPESMRWRPGIHMPRWACRLVLEVVAHRVERLHEIQTSSFKAEGVVIPVSQRGSALIDMSSKYAPFNYLPVSGDKGRDWTAKQIALAHFAASWDKLNKDRGYGWDKNPEVQVIQYRRVR